MADLLALAERVEAATADDQFALLEQAFKAIHGEKPARVHGGSEDLTAWLEKHNPFYQMLVAEAYESAALTLVPEGMDFGCGRGIDVETPNKTVCHAWVGDAEGGLFFAATPALALCAAALRARAAQQGEGE